MKTATQIAAEPFQFGELEHYDPQELKPHPDNPRGEIDANSPEVVQLSEDIGRRGLIQPIVATPDLLILAGHRRRVAAIRAGLKLVPVVIRELQSHEFAEEFFISENMQRQDLSALEEAHAISALHKKLEKEWKRKVTMKDLGRRIDMPTNTITMRLAILDLPDRVQKLFHVGELPINSSRQLQRLAQWPDEVEKFADRMVTRQITLSSLDGLITRRIETLCDGKLERPEPVAKGNRDRVNAVRSSGSMTPTVTRDVALNNLAAANGRSISLFNVKAVFESICCSCGMIGTNEVCNSCPLPKFVNGLVGRADGGHVSSFQEDDE